MPLDYFIKPDIQQLIKSYIEKLSTDDLFGESGFSLERNKLLVDMLTSFLEHPSAWDERSQFNIEAVGGIFIRELSSLVTEENINNTFTSCLRFYLETYVFDDADHFTLANSVKDFAIYRQKEFDPISYNQITYALQEMPIAILKKILSDDSIKAYKEYLKRAEDLEDASKHWDKILTDNLNKSQQLNNSLLEQATAFNFVGLYRGFAELGEKKLKELVWARRLMFMLGLAIPLPLFIEMLWLSDLGPITDGWKGLLKIAPILSLTLILIYFFRVALVNFNSVRAQLVQIDLRKSLCQFIQNYAEYAKGIREENSDLLVKFEEVIFSNIMPSEEKIPPTFDGLEQLANLVSSFKGGK